MSVIEQQLKSLIASQSEGREGLPAAGCDSVYIQRALAFCPKISSAYIQNRLDENFIRIRRNRDLARLLEEAKRRDERATKWELEEGERRERAAEAEIIAREEAAKEDRERVTLGEHYPAFAPGCWKTKIASDWYDEDRWEKVEENYSADRRLTGQFLWNRGLVNDEHYGAGRFSSLFKSPEEQEVTFAEANRAAKIYKRRRFSGG
jgi:hypothetical protein|tara:strand:- start:34 stop:651 length:618 start_codon:yes stop_codon:yes gene_type:complete